MQKTFQELEKELVDSKKREEKLKKRYSSLHHEVLESRRYMKSLIGQYERVVRDWKKTLAEYQDHIFKMFFITIYKKFKERGGER